MSGAPQQENLVAGDEVPRLFRPDKKAPKRGASDLGAMIEALGNTTLLLGMRMDQLAAWLSPYNAKSPAEAEAWFGLRPTQSPALCGTSAELFQKT